MVHQSAAGMWSWAAALTLVLVAGCLGPAQPPVAVAPDVPYASAGEVEDLLTTVQGPMLLEFCVPAGCYRCDEMRPAINALAHSKAVRLTARRVNLNAERGLANRWGVTVCPTYVVVAGGEEVGRAEYPTSADLIAAMIPSSSTIE